MIDWTEEDTIESNIDGWGLFWTYDEPGYEPYQLQKIDDPELHDSRNVFEDDVYAWEHVFNKAQEESPLHKKALKFLKEHSIKEYNTIIGWMEHHYTSNG